MISLTSPVKTWAHRWPAGLKLGGLCLISMVLFAVQGAGWHLAFLTACLTLYALPGRVFLRTGFQRLWILWPFVALILLWHLAVGSGLEGATIVLRMVTAVGLANLVTMTTTLSDMMGVIRWLARPLRSFGLETRMLEVAVALVVRFTPVLAQKGQGLGLAWRARSKRRPGWRLILPFAVLAIDDAEQVAEALRARGGL